MLPGASSAWLALRDDTSDAAALQRSAGREGRKGSLNFLRSAHLRAAVWSVVPSAWAAVPSKCVPSEASFHVLQMTAAGDHGAFADDVLWQARGSGERKTEKPF